MAMRPSVRYKPCATSSREQTVNIITFTQFEEWNLLSENCYGTESGNKSDDYSTLSPLIIEEKMDVMQSGDGYDSEPTSTDMLILTALGGGNICADVSK